MLLSVYPNVYTCMYIIHLADGSMHNQGIHRAQSVLRSIRMDHTYTKMYNVMCVVTLVRHVVWSTLDSRAVKFEQV